VIFVTLIFFNFPIPQLHFSWSRIINGSSVLLSIFTLRLDFSAMWQTKDLLGMKRRLTTIELSNITESHQLILLNIGSTFGHHLHTLRLFSCKIDDHILRELLKNTPLIEKLELSEVSVVKKLPADRIRGVSLWRLKSLSLHHCDWKILDFINCQVTNFEIKSYLDEGKRGPAVDFLLNCHGLENLSLLGTSARMIFQHDEVSRESSFNLKVLRLSFDFGRNCSAVDWNIITFLSVQEESLLHIDISGPNCEQINSYVIANMNQIKTLAIDTRSLPKDISFYEFLKQNLCTSLKSLSLRGFFVHLESIKRVALKYPALEKIELDEWGSSSMTNSSELLVFIAKYFPRLKQLAVTDITSADNIRFTELKKLSVNYITKSLLRFIVSSCPSIVNLKIGLIYIGQVNPSLIDDLKCIKISHLSLAGSRTALKKLLQMLPQEISRLKALEFNILHSEAKSERVKSLKLKFPLPSYVLREHLCDQD